jgi:hypothetical protein
MPWKGFKMDHEYDPVAGFARAAETMAQTNLRIEETQRLALRTIRGLAWLQGFALAVLALALGGMGYLIWLGLPQGQEHAALTRALIGPTEGNVRRTAIRLWRFPFDHSALALSRLFARFLAQTQHLNHEPPTA